MKVLGSEVTTMSGKASVELDQELLAFGVVANVVSKIFKRFSGKRHPHAILEELPISGGECVDEFVLHLWKLKHFSQVPCFR